MSEETELRGYGNISFPPDTDLLSLREWYNKYNQEGTRDMFIKVPTGLGKAARGTAFSLELFIHVDRVSGCLHALLLTNNDL